MSSSIREGGNKIDVNSGMAYTEQLYISLL